MTWTLAQFMGGTLLGNESGGGVSMVCVKNQFLTVNFTFFRASLIAVSVWTGRKCSVGRI